MQPSLGSYHSGYNFTPSFRPYRPAALPSHAMQYHAPQRQLVAASPTQPTNRYMPGTTIRRLDNGRSLQANTQLKPGEVVEVMRPGHQAELQYATYGGHLAPLTTSTLNRAPNEIRDQIRRVGGPSYFAHDLHNRLPTSGLYPQFASEKFHGPNRPLI